MRPGRRARSSRDIHLAASLSAASIGCSGITQLRPIHITCERLRRSHNRGAMRGMRAAQAEELQIFVDSQISMAQKAEI